jgi:acyl carrier protein
MTRQEIFEKVRAVIVDTLAVDEEEVSPQSTLIGDLGAESIDFLHIEFELQKVFAFKTQQGELFPDNVARNPEYVQEGKVTPKGLSLLKERLPHLDLKALEADPRVEQVARVFTVDAIVNFVARKLGVTA